MYSELIMAKKSGPYDLAPMDPVPVSFAKFNGGVIAREEGIALGMTEMFIGVRTLDDQKVYFRRRNGWGIGVSKHWRLSIHERDKYVHDQEKPGVEYKFKKV